MSLPEWVHLEAVRILFIFAVQFFMSYLVREERIKVNYSRKVAHFSHILSTLLLNRTFLNYSIEYFIISGFLSLCQILIFAEPIRKRVPALEFFFLSFDRPEDRPHTVRLAFTQILGMNVAIIGLAYLYNYTGLSLELLAIPMFITAFGDGLAEPVGIRFGRYRYEVTSLFSDRVYTRSVAGSSMVVLSTILTLISMSWLFSSGQLLLLTIIMPPLMTAVEAFSPHTWDNPFLYLAGGLTVYLVLTLT